MGFSLQGSIKTNLSFFLTSCSDNIWVSVLNGASCLKQPFLDSWKEAACLGGCVTVHIPQRLLYSWLLMLHYGRGEKQACLCVFMRRQNGLWQCPCHCGRTVQSWYVCEPASVCVCTLWHCHWSSLASCSEMQGTDKDFIQPFLTHKHTKLCPYLRVCLTHAHPL